MNNHEAIFQLNPSVVTIHGDIAYDANGAVVQYDATAVANLVKANAYKSERQTAYPTIGDQLDMLWHAMANGEIQMANTFFHSIQTVKNNYPKS